MSDEQVKKLFLVVAKNETEEIEEKILKKCSLAPKVIFYRDEFEIEEDALYLLYLSDEETKAFLLKHQNLEIGILPNEKNPDSISSYGISKNIDEAIDDALSEALLSTIDLLLCNGIIVLNRVKIGDMHDLHRQHSHELNSFQKIGSFFKNLFNISYKSITLTTAKEQTIQTAASGIMVVEHTTKFGYSTIDEELSLHDGKLNAFILAPTSLISYCYYLILILFFRKFSAVELPKSLGYIKTAKLLITAPKPFDFTVDRSAMSAKEIALEILPKAVKIHLGKKLSAQIGESQQEEKDTIKTSLLPKGEIKNQLILGKVPLFKKAESEDFKELFGALRESARFSSIFAILMVLSTLLATVGLFQNSAPVIIGAMVLAPLMSPIISLSMGAIRAEKELLTNSIKTLAFGIIIALLFSSLFTLLTPLNSITNEMQGRLHPNILDLMVAIFSGIAGAYANAKSEVAKSLAGVAIAVALVPPLSVTGIGIGWGNTEIIYGSFLLFITNLVGITLFASLTFIILGFSPIKRAKNGILIVASLLLVITIPLTIAFKKIIDANQHYTQVAALKDLTIADKKVHIEYTNIESIDEYTLQVDIELLSEQTLGREELQQLKNLLESKLEQKIVLKIQQKMLL